MAKSKVMPLSQIENEIEDFIASQINSYAKELEVKIDKELEEVANDFVEKLKPVTPVDYDSDGGKYGHLRDNLNVKKKKSKGHTSFVVNYGKKGWLSTLLEYGWTAVNGRLIKRKAFIRPTFEKNKERYFKKIKQAVEKQVSK